MVVVCARRLIYRFRLRSAVILGTNLKLLLELITNFKWLDQRGMFFLTFLPKSVFQFPSKQQFLCHTYLHQYFENLKISNSRVSVKIYNILIQCTILDSRKHEYFVSCYKNISKFYVKYFYYIPYWGSGRRIKNIHINTKYTYITKCTKYLQHILKVIGKIILIGFFILHSEFRYTFSI